MNEIGIMSHNIFLEKMSKSFLNLDSLIVYYKQTLTMITAIIFVDFTRKKIADRMAGYKLSLMIRT